MRGKFFSFLGFWVAQMLWVWIVSLPVTVLNSPNVTKHVQPAFGTGCDIAGTIMFAIGFIMESVSDVQKYLYRSNPDNKGKVCDVGFFAWTRHPNYFGEILIQFGKLLTPLPPKKSKFSCPHQKNPPPHPSSLYHPGIFTIAIAPAAYNYVTGPASHALYATILGPIFLTTLLLFVSGLNLQERPGAKKRYESGNHWDQYSRYTQRTSILLPFPPPLYVRLPTLLKRTLFLEFPIYVFDPKKHADPGKVRDRERDDAAREEGQGGDDGNVV